MPIRSIYRAVVPLIVFLLAVCALAEPPAGQRVAISAPEVAVINNIAMVAAAPLAELLGVSTAAAKGSVTLLYQGHTFTCTLGQPVAHAGEQAVELPLAPFGSGETVYLPLLPCLKALGGSAKMDLKGKSFLVALPGMAAPLELPATQWTGKDRFRDNDWELYAMHADGSGMRRLTYDSGDNAPPLLSPDGTVLVSQPFGAVKPCSLRPLNASRAVTISENCDVSGFNAEGSLLLFAEYPAVRDAAHPMPMIGIVRPDGSWRRLLTMGENPRFSGDGKWIVYTTWKPGQPARIGIIRPDGTGQRLLAEGRAPCSNPDGSQVAFTRFDAARRLNVVYVIDARGGAPHKLGDGEEPFFTRDGTMVVARRAYPKYRGMTVEMLVAFGVAGEQAGKTIEPPVGRRTSVEYFQGFAPDGNIYVVRENDGLYLLSPDRTREQRLVKGDVWGAEAAPGGKGVYFIRFSAETGEGQLCLLKPDGTVAPLTPETRDVPNYAVTRDGNEILFTAVPNAGIAPTLWAETKPEPPRNLHAVPFLPEAMSIKGVVVVPVQPLAALLDAEISTLAARTVVTLGDKLFTFTPGNTAAQANGVAQILPLAPFRRVGVDYVPLRPLVEALGGKLSVANTKPMVAGKANIAYPTGAELGAATLTLPGMKPLILRLVEAAGEPAQYRDNDPELYWLDLEDGSLLRLTYDMQRMRLPAISPDGRWLAYWYEGRKTLLLHPVGEPAPRRRLEEIFCADRPSFDPGGGRLIFSDGRQIYAAGLEGILHPSRDPGDAPLFSPDGEKIALRINFNLHVLDNQGRLRPIGLCNRGYAFSPDGARLLYWNETASGTNGLIAYQLAGDGAGTAQVLNTPGMSVLDAAFSPDGSQVVFTRTIGLSNFRLGKSGICVTGDFAEVHQLTENATDRLPRFTLDGREILFVRRERGSNLYAIDLDGTGLHHLTNGPSIIDYDLLPDGRHALLLAYPEPPPMPF